MISGRSAIIITYRYNNLCYIRLLNLYSHQKFAAGSIEIWMESQKENLYIWAVYLGIYCRVSLKRFLSSTLQILEYHRYAIEIRNSTDVLLHQKQRRNDLLYFEKNWSSHRSTWHHQSCIQKFVVGSHSSETDIISDHLLLWIHWIFFNLVLQ